MSSKASRTDARFEASISPWTLKFHDPAYEESFMKVYDTKSRLPLFSRLIAYTSIAYLLAYRVYAIYGLLAHEARIQTGTLSEELSSLCIVVTSILIELIPRFVASLMYYQGLLFYTTLPVMFIYIAYYTNKGPIIGVT